MPKENVKVKTELTREEVVELLGLYHVIDGVVSDFQEMFDTDLGKIRKLQEMSYTLKNLFDFRPRTNQIGEPDHWRPYVMPDDDRAWYHTPEED
tara:strand:- start:709 stop:990 length:282 start_codon:yes stop_codon:yes gene_type:complete